MLSKNTLLLCIAAILYVTEVSGQSSPIGESVRFTTNDFRYKDFIKADKQFQDTLDKVSKRMAAFGSLLGSSEMVTVSNYNALVAKNFRLLSGNEIKNGKYLGSAAVVDEKSLTVNLSYKPFKNRELYVLPTASAEAEDGFLDIFSDGGYRKTYSYGSNFAVLLFGNSSNFLPSDKKKLHNDLRLSKVKYEDASKKKETDYFSERIKELNSGFKSDFPKLKRYIDGDSKDADSKAIAIYKDAVDTLVATGILPKYFSDLNADDQKVIVGKVDLPRIQSVVLKRFLDKVDQSQQNAKFTRHSIRWVSGGMTINHVGHDILAADLPELTRKSIDTYISAKLAFTQMYVAPKGHRFYFSPSINFSDAAYYPKKAMLKAQSLGGPLTIGTTTVQPVSNEISYYAVKSTVKNEQVYFDLPFAYYNSKQSLGIEIGLKAGWNDDEEDNVSVRVGPLIALNPKAETQFIFQPILKLSELNRKHSDFWKESFVFGANLSVSLPKGLFK